MSQSPDETARDTLTTAVESGQEMVELATRINRKAVEVASEASREAADAAARSSENLAQSAETASQPVEALIRDGAEQAGLHAERVAGQSFAAMTAASDYNRAVIAGFQAIAGEWADWARTGATRTFERMTALSQARNPADLIGAQRDLVWGGVEDLLAAQQRIGKLSLTLAADAAQQVSGATGRLAA